MNSRGDGPDGASLVAGLGERALIERIRLRLPQPPPSLVVGVCDDAAVAAGDRGALQVLTTDALVEGVHFDRRIASPADVGYRALAVNVSDVAAMGGTSRFALLSLMLPDGTSVAEVDGLLDGLLELADALRVTLAGGNITRSPGPLVVDVTVLGSVKPRKILARSGGHAGDSLYVTGAVGAAAAGLGWLRQHGGGRAPEDPALAECVARYRRPEPRARIGAMLGRTKAAQACMDTSDGLADAIRQICEASGTGATIDASALPVHPGARRWFEGQGQDPIAEGIGASDDYELLFSVSRRSRGRLRGIMRESRGIRITRIGELTSDRTVRQTAAGRAETLPAGFAHF